MLRFRVYLYLVQTYVLCLLFQWRAPYIQDGTVLGLCGNIGHGLIWLPQGTYLLEYGPRWLMAAIG